MSFRELGFRDVRCIPFATRSRSKSVETLRTSQFPQTPKDSSFSLGLSWEAKRIGSRSDPARFEASRWFRSQTKANLLFDM